MSSNRKFKTRKPTEENLFGERIIKKKRKTKLEIALASYDKNSFYDRLARLKYLHSVFPRGIIFAADIETAFIFDEIKMAFINGEFISTLILSQAFIERRLQVYYEYLGFLNVSKRGMKSIIDHAKKNKIIITFFLSKIDELRRKRNAFSHLKEFTYDHNLTQRIFKSLRGGKDNVNYYNLLEEDAKEAIKLMYSVAITDFDKIKPAQSD